MSGLPPTEPLLQVTDLRCLFPVRRGLLDVLARRRHAIHAVDAVTFDLQVGEVLALVGESGCGKSTTGRLLVRMLKPTSGEIRFRGRDIANLAGSELKAFRREAQIIFQNPFEVFDPRQTIGSSLRQALDIHAIGTPAQRDQRVHEALEGAGLSPPAAFLARYPHELSGGQLQRIATVRAMLLEPRLLVADEPVSMLDVSVRAEILNHLLDLRGRYGTAIVFITHDIAVARYVATRVAVMYLGAFMEIGTVEEVIDRPRHPYTRALLTNTLSIDEELPSGERIEISGDPPSPVNLGAGCRLAGRCPFTMDRCRTETPRLRSVGSGHRVACHLVEETNAIASPAIPAPPQSATPPRPSSRV